MNVDAKTFHRAKDKFTTFRGTKWGAKIFDRLTTETVTSKEFQETVWKLNGAPRFRLTAYPKKPGQVFPECEYEIL